MGSSSNEGIFFQAMVLADRYTHTILHNKKKLRKSAVNNEITSKTNQTIANNNVSQLYHQVTTN